MQIKEDNFFVRVCLEIRINEKKLITNQTLVELFLYIFSYIIMCD